MRTWEGYNRLFFEGALSTPVILIEKPGDRIKGNLKSLPHGTYELTETGESKIKITSRLFQPVTGEGGPLFDKFKLWIAQDILLHEMVHQHLLETDQMDVNERQHWGHGPKFAEVCNVLGKSLELQPVYVTQRPYCYAWPQSARTPQQIEKAMEGLNKFERRLAYRLLTHLVENGPDGGPTSGGSVVRQELILAA